MAEEHGFQSPDGGHRLCANNCGFFGSPATHNYCSKCYGEVCMQEDPPKPNSPQENSLFSPSSSPSPSPATPTAPATSPATLFSFKSESFSLPAVEATSPATSFSFKSESFSLPAVEMLPLPAPVRPNRCTSCRKRVGLMGFVCRCGTTFCGTHRYPEQHNCTFDFKEVGREAIAKANPLIIASKLNKI